jgi:hypothetical protein
MMKKFISVFTHVMCGDHPAHHVAISRNSDSPPAPSIRAFRADVPPRDQQRRDHERDDCERHESAEHRLRGGPCHRAMRVDAPTDRARTATSTAAIGRRLHADAILDDR